MAQAELWLLRPATATRSGKSPLYSMRATLKGKGWPALFARTSSFSRNGDKSCRTLGFIACCAQLIDQFVGITTESKVHLPLQPHLHKVELCNTHNVIRDLHHSTPTEQRMKVSLLLSFTLLGFLCFWLSLFVGCSFMLYVCFVLL